MLNEAALVVRAIREKPGTESKRHFAVREVGHGKDLLRILVDHNAKPVACEVIPGKEAGVLLRVHHSSEGASFPGFNLQGPLRRLSAETDATLATALTLARSLLRQPNSSAGAIAAVIRDLFKFSTSVSPTTKRTNDFKLSVQGLAGDLLQNDFASAPIELTNFKLLLERVVNAKLQLRMFADQLSSLLSNVEGEFDRYARLLFLEALFGKFDWKGFSAEPGSPAYWKAKTEADKKLATLPVYLDVAEGDTKHLPVADYRTSEVLNQHLLAVRIKPYQTARAASQAASTAGVDAFSGIECELAKRFFPVKLAKLGNVVLFSNNTKEAPCQFRYGLGGTLTFKVSRDRPAQMNDAIRLLAGPKMDGKTCRAIPGNQTEKDSKGKVRPKLDLLIAYLEDEPEAEDPMADFFGAQMLMPFDLDFAAHAAKVWQAFEGRAAQNPSQRIRLLAIARVSKANFQISINRSIPLDKVILSAQAWEDGARNVPAVSLPVFNKKTRRPEWKSNLVPCPLDVIGTVNQVWATAPAQGLKPSYQRAAMTGDAYDIFFGDSPLASDKMRAALNILIKRNAPVFVCAGEVKAQPRPIQDWKKLNTILGDAGRWQCVKAVAIVGILLHKLGHQLKTFMNEPTYQLGRMLALADALHIEYCQHVRKGKLPSQLIGNALFNTALEQPSSALARLAERIAPYQAWAKTFQSDKPEDNVGLVRWFLHQLADSGTKLRDQALPDRTTDEHKGKLLLGYLADLKNDPNPT